MTSELCSDHILPIFNEGYEFGINPTSHHIMDPTLNMLDRGFATTRAPPTRHGGEVTMIKNSFFLI
jgi:hypothetical protein